MDRQVRVTQNESLTRIAMALAAATVIAFVVLAAVDHDAPGG